MPLRTVPEFILIPYDVDENSMLHLLMFTTILSIMSFDLGTLSVNIFLSETFMLTVFSRSSLAPVYFAQ